MNGNDFSLRGQSKVNYTKYNLLKYYTPQVPKLIIHFSQIKEFWFAVGEVMTLNTNSRTRGLSSAFSGLTVYIYN